MKPVGPATPRPDTEAGRTFPESEAAEREALPFTEAELSRLRHEPMAPIWTSLAGLVARFHATLDLARQQGAASERERVRALVEALELAARTLRRCGAHQHSQVVANIEAALATPAAGAPSEEPRTEDEFRERACPACGAVLAPADTHFALMAGPAAAYEAEHSR